MAELLTSAAGALLVSALCVLHLWATAAYHRTIESLPAAQRSRFRTHAIGMY